MVYYVMYLVDDSFSQIFQHSRPLALYKNCSQSVTLTHFGKFLSILIILGQYGQKYLPVDVQNFF